MAAIILGISKLRNLVNLRNHVAPVTRRFLLPILALLMVLPLLVGCNTQVRKRPYGDLKIGPVSGLMGSETYLPKMRLLVRHDAGGFSVMSTLCTHDLTPLVMKQGPDGAKIFVSSYSESQYRVDGTVIHGPAVANLPYYKATIAEGLLGAPKDTLYVTIGEEVSREWRLPG